MPIATADDVRRVLGRTDVDDAAITPYLDAAEDWVRTITARSWDASGTQTEDFYNVRQGAILYLKTINPTNVVVTGYASPSSSGTTLTEGTQYAVLNRGRIQLARYRPIASSAIRPEERELLGLDPVVWARISVSYTANWEFTPAVTEAVALIAANWLQSSELEVGGVQSEKLGDYSYSMASGRERAIPERAMHLLRPYIARRPHSV